LLLGVALAGILTIVGVVAVLLRKDYLKIERWSLLVALIVSIAAPLLINSQWRFLLTYLIVPLAFTGVGFCALTRGGRFTYGMLTAGLLVFLAMALMHPLDTYEVFYGDTRFSLIAQQLESELKPGDLWTTHPYHYKDPLYRYAALPSPAFTPNEESLAEFLRNRPTDRAVFVVTPSAEIEDLPEFAHAETRGRFVNNFRLLRLPPKTTAASAPTTENK
jgi:hypothetical protein